NEQGSRHLGRYVRGMKIAAENGRDVFGRKPHRRSDVMMVAEVAVRGIEADPTGAGEVNFRPGVERTLGDFFRGAELAQVSAGEAGGEAQTTCHLGEQHGEIAARSPAQAQRFLW